MVVAYVLLTATTGEAERVRDEIAAIDGVDRVHVVAGDVDFIARVVVDTPAAIRAAVVTEMQAIDGIADTRTYLSMD